MLSSSPFVTLANEEEFLKFQPNLIEQILTSNGRVLIPSPEFQICNLDLQVEYQMSLKFKRISEKRLSYIKNEWTEAVKVFKTEPTPEDVSNEVIHPDGPQFARNWLEKNIQFTDFKVSNCKSTVEEKQNMIFLNTQHKYIPILVVTPVARDVFGKFSPSGIPFEFSFQYTEFVTCTRYYSNEVCQMKIGMNKFSKGKVRTKIRENSEEVTEKKKMRKAMKTSDTSLSAPQPSESPKTPEAPEFVQQSPPAPDNFCLQYPNNYQYPNYYQYQHQYQLPVYPQDPYFNYYPEYTNNWGYQF